MLRNRACAVAAFVFMLALAKDAGASCVPDDLVVLVRPIVVGSEAIPVAWEIDGSCPVIETGVIIGTDPEALAPVSEPLYGRRDHYETEVPIPRSGLYWVAVYAREEGGDVVRSARTLVQVSLPLRRDGPHGSHGAPPSYDLSDADFLEPAGEPHYASPRGTTLVLRGTSVTTEFGAVQSRVASEQRIPSSMDRNDVLSHVMQPYVIEDQVLGASSPEVLASLDSADQTFVREGFPRTGLYSVDCLATSTRGFGSTLNRVRCRPITGAGVFGPFINSGEVFSSDTFAGRMITQTTSFRSSVTFFVPRAPAGKRVGSARLRLHVEVSGDASALRLGGKSPIAMDPATCVGFHCRVWATWDFTEEARVLADQAGGPLELALDPVPPVEGGSPDRIFIRRGSATAQPAANYPWRHTLGDDALTLTFEDACPQKLTLTLAPDTIRPQIPQTLRTDLGTMAAFTSVTALVKRCPSTGDNGLSDPVEVAFEVQPPAPGTGDSGGHLHGPPERRTGSFEQARPYPESGAPITTTTCTIDAFDSQGMGSCSVTFHASEISGIETIVARAADLPDAQASVAIQVPGLRDFRAFPSGTWRFTGALTERHTDNHWATAYTIAQAALMATDYYVMRSAVMQVNDMSLPLGGMFDICGTWNRRDTCVPNALRGGHASHRQGTGVDVNMSACVGALPSDPSVPNCPTVKPIPIQEFQEFCEARPGGRRLTEGTYHCEFDQ